MNHPRDTLPSIGCRPRWPVASAIIMRTAVAAGLLATLATACSTAPVVPVGASSDDVIQRAGPPTARLERNGQQRWEYATGPAGRFTWMVDLDTTGKVQGVSQVLTEANFANVRPGQTRDDLRWQLGRPSEQHAIWRGAMLWQYRYDTNNCFWFVVTVEPDGVVRDSGYVSDPACPDVNDRSTN